MSVLKKKEMEKKEIISLSPLYYNSSPLLVVLNLFPDPFPNPNSSSPSSSTIQKIPKIIFTGFRFSSSSSSSSSLSSLGLSSPSFLSYLRYSSAASFDFDCFLWWWSYISLKVCIFRDGFLSFVLDSIGIGFDLDSLEIVLSSRWSLVLIVHGFWCLISIL